MKKIMMMSAVLIACHSAFSALVWSENFSYASGTTLAGTGDTAWNGATGAYWTGNSSNLIMRATHATGGWTFVNNAQTATSVATLSLNLKSDPAFSGNSYLRLAMSGTAGNVALIDFNGGFNNGQTVQTAAYDHFDIIVNNTASAMAIANLGGTIAANTFAVYKNGSAVATASGAATVNADGFGIWMNGGGDTVATPPEVMYSDNMEWRNTAYAIPEPASMGLLAMFGGAMLFVRRRFRI